MTSADMVGTWGCFKSIRRGEEKIHEKPKVTMTFEADGTGHLKLFIVPMQFNWSLYDGILTISNVMDGTLLPVELTEDGFAMTAQDGESLSYFTKM